MEGGKVRPGARRQRRAAIWAAVHVAIVFPLLVVAVPTEKRVATLLTLVVGHLIAYGAVVASQHIPIPQNRERARSSPYELSDLEERQFQHAVERFVDGISRPFDHELVRHFAVLGEERALLAFALIELQGRSSSNLASIALPELTRSEAILHRSILARYMVAAATGDAAAERRAEQTSRTHRQGSEAPPELMAMRMLDDLSSRAARQVLSRPRLAIVAASVPFPAATHDQPLIAKGTADAPTPAWDVAPERGGDELTGPDQFSAVQIALRALARRLRERRVKWLHLAAISTIGYVLAAFAIADPDIVRLAVPPLLIASALDMVDGHLAERSRQYRRAVLFDYYLDRLADAALAMGFFVLVSGAYDFASRVPLVFGMASMYLPYARAEASRLNVWTEGDIFDRGLRNIVLLVSLAAERPVYGLMLATSLTLHSSLRRTGSAIIRDRNKDDWEDT